MVRLQRGDTGDLVRIAQDVRRADGRPARAVPVHRERSERRALRPFGRADRPDIARAEGGRHIELTQPAAHRASLNDVPVGSVPMLE